MVYSPVCTSMGTYFSCCTNMPYYLKVAVNTAHGWAYKRRELFKLLQMFLPTISHTPSLSAGVLIGWCWFILLKCLKCCYDSLWLWEMIQKQPVNSHAVDSIWLLVKNKVEKKIDLMTALDKIKIRGSANLFHFSLRGSLMFLLHLMAIHQTISL